VTAYPSADLPIVDGHLDLAENVTLFGLDLTRPVPERRAAERRTAAQATVSLPDLERGGVAVVCATVTGGFLEEDVGADFEPRSALYRRREEAQRHALDQMALYARWEREGRIRLLMTAGDLDRHLRLWREDRKPGLVLLMEGADPILDAGELADWWKGGLRLIGVTYGDTVYGRGVGSGSASFRTGGLTAAGEILLDEMARIGFIWDISHLAEDGVREGLARDFPRICASHANARALTPNDRHLSDEIIEAIGSRGGVIGLVLYNAFLEPAWRKDRSLPVTLDRHLRRHAEHIARVAGWEHIGIGSDLDGGLGLEESPEEIDTVADLWKVGTVVPPAAAPGVLGGNWLRFLRAALPAANSD
jgi:membrane dipeptidase